MIETPILWKWKICDTDKLKVSQCALLEHLIFHREYQFWGKIPRSSGEAGWKLC